MAIIDILRNELDRAGRRRVLIQIDGDEVASFKFPADTTVEQARAEIVEWLERRREIRQAAIDDRIERAQITNAIKRYYAGQLTLAQQRALLERLISEWREG